MTHLAPAPETSFCLIRGQPVFLDLRRDRYFGLDGVAADALRRLAAGEPAGTVPQEALRRLLATGLFVASATPAEILPILHASPARRGVEDRDRPQKARWRYLPELLSDLLLVKAALARRRLPRLVEAHRAARQSPAPLGFEREALRLVDIHRALRPLVPVRPNCLSDSLALSAFLRRRGIVPDLVFGVKLAPFGAHCWLQLGDIVLNDCLDNACDFTPILVA